ncbi:MAG: polysaccharide biosynthesis C-terminal domain-containing protein [Saprospirales bacterium]|nr:polysaccharide biosynthesis C-terminal domain-containing protein [Saprospirales bacterium]
MTISIIIGLQFGIYGLIIGEVVSAYINLFINAYYSKKFLKYSIPEQLKDVMPTVAFSALIGGLLFFLKDYPAFPGIVNVVLISIVGGVVYLALHVLAKTEEMEMLRRLIIPKTLKLVSRG